jgi:hypothetical protein
MNLEKTGTHLKKNIHLKVRAFKIGLALILSNLFFYLLFASSEKPNHDALALVPPGWVEVQIQAELSTPFQKGKKIILIHRRAGQKIVGLLNHYLPDQEKPLVVLVQEEHANKLLQKNDWEIVPYLKNLDLTIVKKDVSYEIRY